MHSPIVATVTGRQARLRVGDAGDRTLPFFNSFLIERANREETEKGRSCVTCVTGAESKGVTAPSCVTENRPEGDSAPVRSQTVRVARIFVFNTHFSDDFRRIARRAPGSFAT